MPIALKEWAVTVRALAEGEQLITLRKGGIREENKHFEVIGSRFFLYPTFDHQQPGLVRESHVPEFGRVLDDANWDDRPPTTEMLSAGVAMPQPASVRVRAWAEIAGSYEIDRQEQLDALRPFHVWTDEYAAKRLKWKPRHPLHVLLLRVHRIPRPVTLKVRESYLGCRSWVEIERDLEFGGTPAVSDAEFAEIAKDIGARISGSGIPA